jgi:TM2 domain-containing membrane protein YozV
MEERTKAQITEELRAEYRSAMKRTAAEEDALKRTGAFGRGGVKSIRVAYLFWFFLGGFGVHRFYLGRTLSGAGMLALTILAALCSAVPLLALFGLLPAGAVLVWWLTDAFLIPKMLP